MLLLKASLWLFPDFWAKFQMLDSYNMNVRSLVSIFFIWLMSPQPRCLPHSFSSSNANEHSPITLPSRCTPLCAKLNELSSSPGSPDELNHTPWTSGLISEKNKSSICYTSSAQSPKSLNVGVSYMVFLEMLCSPFKLYFGPHTKHSHCGSFPVLNFVCDHIKVL